MGISKIEPLHLFRLISKVFFIMAVIGCFLPLIFNLNCFLILNSVVKDDYDRNLSPMCLVLLLYLCSTLVGIVAGIPIMLKKLPIIIDWLFLALNIICGLMLYRYIIFVSKVTYIDSFRIEEYEIQVGIKMILACLSVSFLLLFLSSLHIDLTTYHEKTNNNKYRFLFVLGVLFLVLRAIFFPMFSPLSAHILPIVYFSSLFGPLVGFAIGLIIPGIDVIAQSIKFGALQSWGHGFIFIIFSSVLWSVYGYLLGFLWNYIKKYTGGSLIKNFYLFFLIFFFVDIYRCFFVSLLYDYLYSVFYTDSYGVRMNYAMDYIKILRGVPRTVLMILVGTPVVIGYGVWKKKRRRELID